MGGPQNSPGAIVISHRNAVVHSVKIHCVFLIIYIKKHKIDTKIN